MELRTKNTHFVSGVASRVCRFEKTFYDSLAENKDQLSIAYTTNTEKHPRELYAKDGEETNKYQGASLGGNDGYGAKNVS